MDQRALCDWKVMTCFLMILASLDLSIQIYQKDPGGGHYENHYVLKIEKNSVKYVIIIITSKAKFKLP